MLEKTGRRVKHKANHKFKRMLTGRSIDDRPKRVDNRREFGNFELDAVVGKRNGQESVLMTLIERKTLFQFVHLIDGRDADSVNHAIRAIVKDHGDIIKTITADNGSEFADLSNVLDGAADVYYAHSIAPVSAGPTRPTTGCSGAGPPRRPQPANPPTS